MHLAVRRDHATLFTILLVIYFLNRRIFLSYMFGYAQQSKTFHRISTEKLFKLRKSISWCLEIFINSTN